MHGASEGVYVNGRLTASRLSNADFTAYVSPYLVVSPGGNYTKHIYAGSQRIASRLANGTMNAASITKAGGSAVNYTTKRTRLQNALIAEYDSLGAVYTAMPVSFTGSGTNSGNLLYFYHPDHLGSSSLITNADGIVTQHVEYVPFGEVFIEERNSTWNTPYLFNAKELDEETGLYYYGARYYEPRTSVWLSTDPMQEKYPGFSTYVYTFNNPVMFIDPDGREGLLSKIKETYKKLSNNPKVTARVDGAIKVVSGTAEGVVGLAASTAGVPMGPAAIAHGVDVGSTGINQIVTGQFQSTTTSSTLQQLGVPQGIAEGADLIVGAVVAGGTSVGLTKVKLSPSVPSAASTVSNTAAETGMQLTKKTFGHTFTTHGDDMTNFIVNRAKGSGMAQGQFLDNQKAARFILDNVGKTANGPVNIPIPNGFPARVIMPDGTFKAATHIRLVPSGGGVKTAYPLIL